jgi:hypothetical protein
VRRRLVRLATRVSAPFAFPEFTDAVIMIVAALIPAGVVAGVFQCLVSRDAVAQICRTDRLTLAGRDLSQVFDYYISWVGHVVVTLGVGLVATRGALARVNVKKRRALWGLAVAAGVLATGTVIAGDALHTNLAMLSHERLFRVLSRAPAMRWLFRDEWTLAGHVWSRPTYFAFIPVSGVAAPLFVTATVIVCASRSLANFRWDASAGNTIQRIAQLDESLAALRSYLVGLAIVLVTSTIGTEAYLRTPLGLLNPSDQNTLKSTSDAIGLVWGGTFSLTLLTLCIYPIIVLRRRFSELEQLALHNLSLQRWLEKNRAPLLIPDLQVIVSVLSPATVAMLSKLASK